MAQQAPGRVKPWFWQAMDEDADVLDAAVSEAKRCCFQVYARACERLRTAAAGQNGAEIRNPPCCTNDCVRISICFPFYAVFMSKLQERTRHFYGIDGSSNDDCNDACCFPCVTVVRIEQEIILREKLAIAARLSEKPYQSQASMNARLEVHGSVSPTVTCCHPQKPAKATSEGTAEVSSKETTKGTFRGTAQERSQGVVKKETKGTAQGMAKEHTKGTFEGTTQSNTQEDIQGTSYGSRKRTTKGSAKGSSKGVLRKGKRPTKPASSHVLFHARQPPAPVESAPADTGSRLQKEYPPKVRIAAPSSQHRLEDDVTASVRGRFREQAHSLSLDPGHSIPTSEVSHSLEDDATAMQQVGSTKHSQNDLKSSTGLGTSGAHSLQSDTIVKAKLDADSHTLESDEAASQRPTIPASHSLEGNDDVVLTTRVGAEPHALQKDVVTRR